MNQAPPIELSINVRMSQGSGFNSLSLAEDLKINPTDFMGMAAIMKRFHDLVEEINKQNAKPKP